MKHLISVPVLVLSLAACSSTDDGGGGSGGGTHTGGVSSLGGSPSSGGSAGLVGSGGTPLGSGGSAGSVNTSGGTTTSSGGSSGSSGSSGSGAGGATAGSSGAGGAAAGSTGTSGGSAGSSGGGAGGGGHDGGTAGMNGGGSGGGGGDAGGTPSASFKCDNLSLAPSMTGVAKPSGAAGGLKVLDWAGFKGAASFTFDDNTPSQLANYNALKGTGGHFTWFVVGKWLSGNASSISGYKASIADGQEVANHTYSHDDSGSQSDLTNNQMFIQQNFGVAAYSMAAPNCKTAWDNAAKNTLFLNRVPCGGSVAAVSPRDNTNQYGLPAFLPNEGAQESALSGQLVAGKWRLYVIHGFDSQGGTYQPVPIGSVTGAMSKAVMNGYWVETMTNVGAYWQGQKLIPESATTSAMWTLPSKFPPNMCLRITTTGGTVTQKGKAIPWDPHGYYEISLDAGEVTVQ